MDYDDSKIKAAEELVQSFMGISRALAKFTQQNAEGLGLTLQQLGVLNTIYASPAITLKGITEKLMLPKSTASVVVDELVKLALIQRKEAQTDRREINLSLTKAGEELSKKSAETPKSYIAMVQVMETMSPEEREQLIFTHEKILKALREINKINEFLIVK